jgi:hypothetical protein
MKTAIAAEINHTMIEALSYNVAANRALAAADLSSHAHFTRLEDAAQRRLGFLLEQEQRLFLLHELRKTIIRMQTLSDERRSHTHD